MSKNKFRVDIPTPLGDEVEKLHKQPRGYLKTTAKLVGKTTDEKTLFSLPEVIPESGGNFLREVISRNTCLLYTSPSPRDRTRSRMPSSA